MTVRIWNEDNGITSTTDVDPAGVELVLKTAYEASFFMSRRMSLISVQRHFQLQTSLPESVTRNRFQADRKFD